MRRGAWSVAGVGALALMLAAGGCSDGRRAEAERRAEEAKQRAAEATATARKEAQDAARKAADATRDAMSAAADAIEKAADSDTAHKAAEAGAAATAAAADLTRAAALAAAGGALTASIKTALMADRAIDASLIDVDTSESARTVTLTGRVASEGQRASALAIAKERAPGYEVVDRLTVGAGS